LIDAGSCQSYAAIDISLLLEFTNLIIKTKLSNAYGLVVKVLLAVILCFVFAIKKTLQYPSEVANQMKAERLFLYFIRDVFDITCAMYNYVFCWQCLAIARKLLDTSDEVILNSYDRHWLSLYELYSQVRL
jgi:hypothetical protein